MESVYASTHQAAGSYSAHILTYSSRWWGPSMEESLVRYSKLSMMTATNRFSICTHNNLLATSATSLSAAYFWWVVTKKNEFFLFIYLFFTAQGDECHHLGSYQEWTEEYKGDEVEVGKLAATLRVCVPRQGVAFFISQARQHYLMPRLSRRTPENKLKKTKQNKTGRLASFQRQLDNK